MDLAIDQTGSRTGRPLAPTWAEIGLAPVTEPGKQRQLLENRRWGRIVTEGGALEAVYGRWMPYWGNALQMLWDRSLRRYPRDRCELYYHAPWSAPGFLTLSYVRSGRRTSLATFYAATLVLDEIARIRHSGAIVCNVSNSRISHRLMQRWGWESHCVQWSGRHYIKRLYGNYPEIKPFWRRRLQLDGTGE